MRNGEFAFIIDLEVQKEVVVMKDKVPKVTLRISILVLVLITILLLIMRQPHAILAMFAVIVLSIVYLIGMEKNHEDFMQHHKREEKFK